MNVYFSCSITGGRTEEKTYQSIVNAMLAHGHEVPTAHLSASDVVDLEEIVDPVEVFERDMKWLEECDVVVAEVSSPSHGVGYEIMYGLSLGKPVLCCFHQGKRISKIITGNTNPLLTMASYEGDKEAEAVVLAFLAGNLKK